MPLFSSFVFTHVHSSVLLQDLAYYVTNQVVPLCRTMSLFVVVNTHQQETVKKKHALEIVTFYSTYYLHTQLQFAYRLHVILTQFCAK